MRASCHTKSTWTRGGAPGARFDRATRSSKGTSPWASASTALRRTRARASARVGSEEKSAGMGTVLTKNPTTPSTSARLRLWAGVPTTKRSCWHQVESTIWNAARTTGNRLESSRRAAARASNARRRTGIRAPLEVGSAGRAKSTGSRKGETPSRASAQNDRVEGAISRSRCHRAKSAYRRGSGARTNESFRRFAR